MNNESRGRSPRRTLCAGGRGGGVHLTDPGWFKNKPCALTPPPQMGNLHRVSLLTFYADDFRSVPLSVGAALGGGHVALQEAFGALVADDGVDVVVGALPANQEGVIHGGRGSAKHWRMEKGKGRAGEH